MKSSSIILAAFLVTNLSLLLLLTEAKCSSQTTCEECLLASPAWTFWTEGDYCKFCPRTSLTQRFPIDDEARFLPEELAGACFENDSKDGRAQDSTTGKAPVLGGCALTSGQTKWSVNGWLVPGNSTSNAKNKETRVRDRNEVKRICETIRSLYSTTDESGTTKLTSSIMLSGADATNALRQAVHVTAQVRRDLILALKLRAVDPMFFRETFPDATIKMVEKFAEKGVKTTIGLLIPYSSYIMNGVGAAGAVFEHLQSRAERIMYYGGAANTYSFPEITYAELFSAYLYILNKIKEKSTDGKVTYMVAKEVLNTLKKEADEYLKSAGATAKTVASAVHKVSL
jgi:hypothetical protein